MYTVVQRIESLTIRSDDGSEVPLAAEDTSRLQLRRFGVQKLTSCRVPTDVHQHHRLHSLHIQLTDSVEKFTYRKPSPKHL